MANDFLAWHECHVAMFSLADEDAITVASWRNALAGYSVADLRAASAELLLTAPKSFRNDHVSGFFRILARNRTQHGKQFGSSCPCLSCRSKSAGVAEPLPAPNDFSFVREHRKRQAQKVAGART